MLHRLNELFPIRYTFFGLCVLGLLASLFGLLAFGVGAGSSLVLLALVVLGVYDVLQSRRSILRNYPIIGHLRFMLEFVRPEIRQYFLESDNEASPFSRAQRSLVYQRAKGDSDKRPFGTQLDVHAEGYEWINHSMTPSQIDTHDFRIWIGGTPEQVAAQPASAGLCTQPYNASFFNIFGAEGHEWLTTDSLLDQEEVKDRAVKKARAPWSGLYYVTGGAEEDRPWEELRRYGFFTADGGRIYTNQLDRLEVGAPIFYYQKKTGYLGYGRVTTPKMPASEFEIRDGRKLTDALPTRYLTEFADDPERAAYVVGVEWLRTFDRAAAKTYQGIFANQAIACKIYDQQTADFLRQEFAVNDDGTVA